VNDVTVVFIELPRCGHDICFVEYMCVFSARCNIYDASVRLSVRLSVTFVHCGHRVQWIPDIFACDRLLYTCVVSHRQSVRPISK